MASWDLPPHLSSGLLCDRWSHLIRECGMSGSMKGQCASLSGITGSIEVLGGQGYSFHKFMACSLFFFSCWKCVFVWLWQSCLPWILNNCPSRVLRPWPSWVNGWGQSWKRTLSEGRRWYTQGNSGHCQPGWCLLRSWQHSKNMQKAGHLFVCLFLAALGLRCCARAFSSCGEWGQLFVAVRGLLTVAASLVAEHRL